MPMTTVLDIIKASEDHGTLEIAINTAGLNDDLNGTGPFTVFAPTDSAFAALPNGLLDSLLIDTTGALADILLYHVTNDSLPAVNLMDSMIINTLLGEDIIISIDSNGVFVNNAMVTMIDLQAENGIVHVIDAVLIPLTDPVDTTVMPETIVDIIRDSESHSVLNDLLNLSELDTDLSGNGPFTIFRTDDSAFAKLPTGMLDTLKSNPTGALSSILLYHVLNGRYTLNNFSDNQSLPTIQGESLEIIKTVDTVYVNDILL